MSRSREYHKTIAGCGLLKYVSEKDRASVVEELSVAERNYRKEATIFSQDDVIDSLCIVERGSVRGEKTYPNGDVHIVSIFEEGSIIALEVPLSRKKTSPIDVIANENCRLIMVSVLSIEQSRQKGQLHRALLEMLADDNIRMANKIEILAERGLRDRVLVYLNVLARKSGTDTVQVKMSREQMAQYLCVNRSALSNELNKMKREGIIDFRRGEFRLLKQK